MAQHQFTLLLSRRVRSTDHGQQVTSKEAPRNCRWGGVSWVGTFFSAVFPACCPVHSAWTEHSENAATALGKQAWTYLRRAVRDLPSRSHQETWYLLVSSGAGCALQLRHFTGLGWASLPVPAVSIQPLKTTSGIFLGGYGKGDLQMQGSPPALCSLGQHCEPHTHTCVETFTRHECWTHLCSLCVYILSKYMDIRDRYVHMGGTHLHAHACMGKK